jgi:hypothetical protein
MKQATKLAELLGDQLRYDPAEEAFTGSFGDEDEVWSAHLIDQPDGS